MVVSSNSVPMDSQPIQAGQVTSVTLKLLTGSQIEGGRKAGVFTTDDLIKILLYVRSSRQLPQNLQEFQKELGIQTTGIAGLEPVNVIDVFKKITDHANRWTPVENLVKQQSSNLTIASREIVNIGSKIIDVIDKMDTMEQLETLGNSTVTIPITSDKDKKVQTALPTVIQKLKDTCVEQQEKSRQVLTAVRDYKTEISGGTLSNNTTVTGLEPAVADKKKRAQEANLDGQIKQLQTEVDTLQTQIDQLNKDYDKYTGLAFTGAAGGFIGLAITGGIYGSKAENARKERNSKIQEKENKSQEIQRKQKLQGILNVLSTKFTDIGMRLLDAEQALQHLDFLWTDMVARIDQSVDKWKAVNDSAMLLEFVIDLKGIVDPWKEVGDMSTQLVEVFDQAYEEFKQTYGA